MSTQLNPYLSFRSEARDAMEFYRSVLGGELDVMTFREIPMPEVEESEYDLLMHAQLTTSSGLILMGADTPASMEVNSGTQVTISLSGTDAADLRRYWEGLSEGATIAAPLEPAPWGGSYGMLTDRFGIPWMINIEE